MTSLEALALMHEQKRKLEECKELARIMKRELPPGWLEDQETKLANIERLAKDLALLEATLNPDGTPSDLSIN